MHFQIGILYFTTLVFLQGCIQFPPGRDTIPLTGECHTHCAGSPSASRRAHGRAGNYVVTSALRARAPRATCDRAGTGRPRRTVGGRCALKKNACVTCSHHREPTSLGLLVVLRSSGTRLPGIEFLARCGSCGAIIRARSIAWRAHYMAPAWLIIVLLARRKC